MATERLRQVSIEHPAPHRHRVGLAALFFGLGAAPFAWNMQLLFGAALSGHACYPRRTLLAVPMWPGVWWWLLAIDVAGIALAVAGGLVAWRSWRLASNESSGSVHHLLDAGEGRTRFLAMFGILASCIFTLGLVFATAAMFLVPLCR